MKHHKIGLGITFAVALGIAAPSLAQQAVQWRVEDGGNGHWYGIIGSSTGIGWTAARELGEARGGHLACAETPLERIMLFSAFSPDLAPGAWVQQAPWTDRNWGPWIGGMQLPKSAEPLNGWMWVTGSNFDPSELGCCNDSGCNGEEDRLHLLLLGTTVTWNDVPDTWTCGEMPHGLVVEWSADCNNDGIVDYGQILDGTYDDLNANGVPDCCDAGQSCIPCPGDITGNGSVDGTDLAALLGAWGSNGKGEFQTDRNDDGTVDAGDLSIVLAGWGPCPD